MTNRNQMRHGRVPLAALVLGGFFLLCRPAGAVIFTPGAPAEPTPGAFTFAGLTLLADETLTVTGYDTSDDARYTATVESKVLQEPTGTLDFAYQVTNISSGPETDSLHTVSVTNYRNFTTNVDFVAATGTVTYDTVQRKLPGQGITVSMDYTPAANSIAPGDDTDWIIIKTNAVSFDDNGTTTLIDGATAMVTTFEPVPEPGSFGVIAAAGAVLAGRRGRRNRISV